MRAMPHHGRASDYLELTKPNIVGLILCTVAAGYYLGSPGPVDLLGLIHVVVGSALVAAGSNALNQILERQVDAEMHRTRGRPLPSGRLRAAESTVVAWSMGVAGVVYLWLLTNALVAVLAAVTLGSYVFVYTPLKRYTSFSTVVGAVPGALPVVGGWAAGRGSVNLEAWVLFGILFLWQLPHFLALAWLYRDDYARAGLRMLSVTSGAGATFRQALAYAVALLPVSLVPTLLGTTGMVYFGGALVLAVWLIAETLAVTFDHSPRRARRLFLVTVIYLPVILVLMIVDKAT
ncbi:MAG: heme o synthase [Gemmatimonadota bacterium]|nr:heme o synthase [Gemmatimonadota bacterium]MDH3477447.1 heme o synthase [Gemmatimonadota bacterium]